MRTDLQKRLIRFAGMCMKVKGTLIKSYEGDYLAKQLIRSSISAALNYGEAQASESQKDFIHKQSILLKELRESYVNLLIIKDNRVSRDPQLILHSEDECNQLISIFVTSIQTTKRKMGKI